MSYLEIYCDKILSGEIIACDKIKTICKKLKHDMHHPGKWHFDEDLAKKIMSEEAVEILVQCGDGNASGTAWGCDLTYDYVKINADYRS